MTIWHIALNNLRQRAVRSLLVMFGLAIGIASLVSINTLLTTMRADMEEQLSDFGPNLLVTAGTGEITFSYGGITLPGVIVGAKQLTSRDAAAISDLGGAVKVMVPKLIARTSTYGRAVLVAGTDIKSEFAIKPWLRIVDYLAKFEQMNQTSASPDVMGGEALDLTREDPALLELTDNEVILGAGVAFELGLYPTNRLVIEDREFVVKAVLEKNGTAEDEHIMMNLPRAQAILGMADELTLIEVAADLSRGSEQGIVDQLQAALPDAKVTSLGKAGTDRSEIMGLLSRFGLSASACILLAGMLAASFGMSASVVERTREIGIFRAIGLRRTFIQKVILLEGALLSTIGGILGYVAGTFIARISLPLLVESESAVAWHPPTLIAAVALALLVGLAASAYPARRAARLDPADALRLL